MVAAGKVGGLIGEIEWTTGTNDHTLGLHSAVTIANAVICMMFLAFFFW